MFAVARALGALPHTASSPIESNTTWLTLTQRAAGRALTENIPILMRVTAPDSSSNRSYKCQVVCVAGSVCKVLMPP